MHVYIFMPDIIRGQDLVSGNGGSIPGQDLVSGNGDQYPWSGPGIQERSQYPWSGDGIRERGSISVDRIWYPGTGAGLRDCRINDQLIRYYYAVHQKIRPGMVVKNSQISLSLFN